MQTPTGIVFDIKKFSIHDGPGIRTTVFLKGCPLHCSWCHNPEGISPSSEIQYWDKRCIGCQECVEACEHQAIAFVDEQRVHYPDLCQGCGACAQACPAEAIELIGSIMTVSEVIEAIEKDVIYYDQSGGGASFSGGEPLLQTEFLRAVLKACKDHDIHTVVDTSGYVSFNNFSKIRPLVDLFLYDIKLMDTDRHIQYTGVPNQLILENMRELVKTGAQVTARIPIIPWINDDMDNIRQTGEFLRSLGSLQEVNLLPYHRAATHKYQRLGSNYLLPEVLPPSDSQMSRIAWELDNYGLSVKIGG
jgi:pyruvate formate lyase activating enzyme